MRRLQLAAALMGLFVWSCSDDAPSGGDDAGSRDVETDAALPDAADLDAGLGPDIGLADATPLDLGPSEDAGVPIPDLFPLRVGAVWTYLVTDSGGGTGTKTQTATGLTTLPSVTGDVFVMETLKSNGDRTVSYQQDTGPDVIRFSEDNFDAQNTLTGGEVYLPYKLRVPKTLAAVNEQRTETFREQTVDANRVVQTDTNKTVVWTLEAIESVTVPAGTFQNALRMRKNTTGTASDKLFWFVAGVGKIKEVGVGQTEELSSYSFP